MTHAMHAETREPYYVVLTDRPKDRQTQLAGPFDTMSDANDARTSVTFNYRGRSAIVRMPDGRRWTRSADIVREIAAERLRAILSPGDTVHTVLRHVSSSGMMRHLDLYKIDSDGDPRYLTGYVATLLDWSRTDAGYLRVSGCGMDVGFHAVYTLSHLLYPDGFACVGNGCPSNDHSNREVRDWHPSGGYALKHRWL